MAEGSCVDSPPALETKNQTEQRWSSPSPWGRRQCQVDALGLIFSDVGRSWELPLRHRLRWVCVRCEESVHACTRVGALACMLGAASSMAL